MILLKVYVLFVAPVVISNCTLPLELLILLVIVPSDTTSQAEILLLKLTSIFV